MFNAGDELARGLHGLLDGGPPWTADLGTVPGLAFGREALHFHMDDIQTKHLARQPPPA